MNFLSLLGISDAYAATVLGGEGGFASVLPMMILLFLFMYLLIIRPQQKRAREHKDLVGGLKTGDEVLTSGGLLGKVNKITDQFVKITVAENIEIALQKSSITAVLPKGTLKSV